MPLQVAQVLSDLTSLLICENPDAAKSLVTSSSSSGPQPSEPSDPDFQRATTLLSLHAAVKTQYAHSGQGSALAELEKMRMSVRRAVSGLGRTEGEEAVVFDEQEEDEMQEEEWDDAIGEEHGDVKEGEDTLREEEAAAKGGDAAEELDDDEMAAWS